MAAANGLPDQQIAEADIDAMVKEEEIPASLATQTAEDPELLKKPLFRRIAGAARITVFEGGHDQDKKAALNWLSRQVKGKPADFTIQSVGKAAEKRKGKMDAVTY